MDTISLGATLSFAMELQRARHAGRWRSTSASPAGVTEMIHDIGHRRGLGDDLADGVEAHEREVRRRTSSRCT